VIRKERGVEATLVRGSGGEFEVTLDGRLIFSKRAEGRFPEPEEVLAQLPR
jgi:selenoprotein W-related protein